MGDPIGTLVIPEIGVDQVVVEGTGSAQLAVGPGHYVATPLPGQPGNVGIAGHRTTHGRPFYDLNDLVTGDPITVTTLQGTFRYLVVRSEVVAPTDLTRAGAVGGAGADPDHLHPSLQRRPAPGRGGPTALAGRPGHARPAPLRDRRGGPGGSDPSAGELDPAGPVGLAALGLVALVVVARRRMAPRRAWLAPLVAVPAALVLLYFLFGAVNTVLPATY